MQKEGKSESGKEPGPGHKPKRNANGRFAYEHFSQPLLPWHGYLLRMIRHGGLTLLFLGVSLFAGMVGYHYIAEQSWIDSYLNACMILTGMGPVNPMTTFQAKIFSGAYALYSGIAFLTCIGLFFAPILHRLLHKFHLNK